MNLTEAMEFIHCTDWKGSRLGLERIAELMHKLGDPQDGLRFVHVAGTNGKGSVCAMLSSVLTAAGYRTGLYTSPHLCRLNERMKINGTDISDAELIALAEEIKPQADQMKDMPTEFEIITAMAFLYFKKQHCDIVVLEVGLGGRLDSTNIIRTPEVAVICNIGLEHTEVLGDTLEKIAAEKAGIIKPEAAAVLYGQSKAVEDVIRHQCRQCGVELRVADFARIRPIDHSLDGQLFDWKGYRRLRLGLLGVHQLHNAAVVLETVECLANRGWKIGEEAVRRGLADVRWPARLEVLSRSPLFILDGAHNPQCAETLASAISENLPNEKIVFLTGVLADKEYRKMMDLVLPYASSFVCLTPESPRALPGEKLAAYLLAQGAMASVCDSAEQGIAKALEKADGGAVVAFGSLYLAGAIETSFRSSYQD